MKGATATTELIKRIQKEGIMPVETFNIRKGEGEDLIKKWNLWYFPVIVVIDTDYKPRKKTRSRKGDFDEWIDQRRDEIHASTIIEFPDYVWERLKRMAKNNFAWKDLYDKYKGKRSEVGKISRIS